MSFDLGRMKIYCCKIEIKNLDDKIWEILKSNFWKTYQALLLKKNSSEVGKHCEKTRKGRNQQKNTRKRPTTYNTPPVSTREVSYYAYFLLIRIRIDELCIENVFLLLTDQYTVTVTYWCISILCIAYWLFCAHLQIWAFFWLFMPILPILQFVVISQFLLLCDFSISLCLFLPLNF